METSIIGQLLVIGFVALLFYSAFRFRSYLSKKRAKKILGSAMIIGSSIFGGTQYDPNKEAESEKTGQSKD